MQLAHSVEQLTHPVEKVLAGYLVYAAWGLSRMAQAAAAHARILDVLGTAPGAAALRDGLGFAGGVAPLAPMLSLVVVVWALRALRCPEDEALVFPALLGLTVVAKLATWGLYLLGLRAMDVAIMAVG